MKKVNILKYVFASVIATFMLACETTDDNFSDGEDPTSGWIEFSGSGTSLSSVATAYEAPLDINVPIFTNGLTIGYELQPVTGDFDDIVTSPASGTVRIEADNYDREVSIPLTFSSLVGLPELIEFDVVLTSVDQDGVRIGVGPESNVRFRISSPCPFQVNMWTGSYSVDEVFTDGINAGLSLANAFGESYQMDIAPLPGDPSGEKIIVNNSPGFDTYLPNGTEMAFITCTGDLVVNDGNPTRTGDFSNMTISVSTFDAVNFVLQADGTLGNFGPYQWIFTKM